ncbi:MAG: hypothetical protein J5I90_03680 [Caldilineales bacterium]|nr:hypothetical protein [Caldilineales bacterium]
MFALALLVGILLPWPKLAEAGPATGTSYKIKTTEAGIYQVTYEQLTAAGFNATGVDPATFQLFNFGEEVAILLAGVGDNSFDPGDYFLFYAEPHLTRFANYNIYWFVAGEASGLRMQTFDATPGGASTPTSFWRTIHYEDDTTYKSEVPLTGDEADRWYWRFFQACQPGSRTCRDALGNKNDRHFTLDVPNPASETYTATLTMVLRGASNEFANPDHHVVSNLNSQSLDNSYFDGAGQWIRPIDFPSAILLAGANDLQLLFPEDLGTSVSNAGYVNYFDLRYRSAFTAVNDRLAFSGDDSGQARYQISGFANPTIEVFDISDARNPRRAANVAVSGGGPYEASLQADNGPSGGAQFFAVSNTGRRSPSSIVLDSPSSLRSPGNQADYIVITHADFMAQAQQLAAYRHAANGYSTYVLDVQDAYDEFNGGLIDPQAIRDFIFYASHYWQQPYPEFVVTFGDGHYDFLNKLGSNETVYFPPWLAAVDPFQGETAADNRYVDVRGNDQFDSDGDNAHTARNIELADGKMALHVDFGYMPASAAAQAASSQSPQSVDLVKAIGDRVFGDEDRDGIFDWDEQGMPGITMNLWRNGSIAYSQQTGADGSYYFEDIASGTYQLEVVPPAGWQFSPKDVGDDDRYDSDIYPDGATKGFSDDIIYVWPQQAQADWDAGVFWPGTIGNRVWLDADGDGLQDANEGGIAGVIVDLLQGGVVIDSQVTDADGFYFFHDKPAGTYAVQIDPTNFDGPLSGLELSPWDQGFDTMPDLKYGRFPVSTVQQATEMVNRVIQYETSSPTGVWQKRALFVADNPDPAGDFWAHSNEVADHIWPYAAESQKIYFQQTHATSTAMKTAIKSGIDQGALFVTYNGHSSKNTWGDSFLTTSDIDALTNVSNGVFPIFLPMTCLEGQFLNPGFVSMGEKVVRTIGKGGIASFSPTGLGVATGHQFLFNAFFEATTSGETNLGELTIDAKQALFQSHSLFRDLLDTYVLFGDPGLQVQMPDADVAVKVTMIPDLVEFLPGAEVKFKVEYGNIGGLPTADGSLDITLSDTLVNHQFEGGPVAAGLSAASATATTYNWNLGPLAPGAGGTITVTTNVDPGLPGPLPIKLSAVIGSSSDNSPENNQSSQSANDVTLGGLTWYDINGNGLADATEIGSGVPNVQISLTRLNDNSVYNTVSDGSGHWSLDFMPIGTYSISAQVPTGLGLTTPNPVQRTLVAGQTDNTINFGYASPTAVELADFRAELRIDGAHIQWQTSSEQDSAGFYVWRTVDPAVHGKRVSPLIASAGADAGASYSYVDVGVKNGVWYYWLEAVGADGDSHWFGPILASVPDETTQKHKVFLGFVTR